MERHYILSSDMNSNNINKIMRSNLHLNSKILSKNTTEILNTCVGKLYKQIPITFQKSLHQGKTLNTTRPENRAPIERLIVQNRHRYSSMKPIKTDTNIYEDQMLNRLMSMSKKPNAQLPKKVSKTPGFKIYNSKRYCSSNSSSSGSIFNRTDDRSRSMRNYHTQTGMSIGKSSAQKSPAKPVNTFSSLTPARNQHMSPSVYTWRHALKVSSHIQKDLMSVDEALKSRLNSLTKANATEEFTSDGTNSVPLKVLSKALKLQTLSTTELKTKLSSKKLTKQPKDMDTSIATVKAAAQKLKQTISIPSKTTSHLALTKQQQQLNPPTCSQPLKNKTPVESSKCSSKHQNSVSVPTLDISTPKDIVHSSTRKRRYTLRNCVPPPPPNEANVSNLEDDRHHKPIKGSGKSMPSFAYCV
ncbi:hypothetical protein DOY81_007573 [Sarcophaga bullata]|nr:hypothetical protein DOY81_007573 [Sarcophaga bullata]